MQADFLRTYRCCDVRCIFCLAVMACIEDSRASRRAAVYSQYWMKGSGSRTPGLASWGELTSHFHFVAAVGIAAFRCNHVPGAHGRLKNFAARTCIQSTLHTLYFGRNNLQCCLKNLVARACIQSTSPTLAAISCTLKTCIRSTSHFSLRGCSTRPISPSDNVCVDVLTPKGGFAAISYRTLAGLKIVNLPPECIRLP